MLEVTGSIIPSFFLPSLECLVKLSLMHFEEIGWQRPRDNVYKLSLIVLLMNKMIESVLITRCQDKR